MKYKATVYYNEIYEKVMEFEIDVQIPETTDIDDHANLIYNTIENEAHDKFDVLMEQDERLRYEIDDVTFQKIEWAKVYLTSENPWVFIDKTNADDFLKEVLKLGKPTEVSIVGAFGKEGRGSTQDMDLPLHFDGEYSARKAAEKGLTFDKKIDILALYCLKGGDSVTLLEWNGNTASIILQTGQALIIDNKICRHGRSGQVRDRMLLRVWIERNTNE